jgi:DNA invertase Pin-like site-specific DNA recombinase
MKTAVAYYRTSLPTNTEPNMDSMKRQQEAVYQYAASNGYEIIREYHEIVEGEIDLDKRLILNEMMVFLMTGQAATLLVENPDRFARDLLVQLTSYTLLRDRGIDLIPVDADDYFLDESPTAIMIRQILGVMAQFEKTALMDKLRGARIRKRLATGRCEGPKPAPEGARALAQQLQGTGLSLRRISDKLAEAGFLSPSGKHYSASSVAAMVRPAPGMY